MSTTISDTVTIRDDGTTSTNAYEGATKVAADMSSLIGERQSHDISDFLKRPVVLGSGQWNTTDAINSTLFTLDFPDAMIAKAMYAEKLAGFVGLRASIKIFVQFNSQPLQQGMVMLHHIPYAPYMPVHVSKVNETITGRSGCANVKLNLAEGSALEYTLPYIAPHIFYNLVTGQGSFGTVYLSVVSPLVSADASFVGYTIWAQFVEPEVMFPTAARISTVHAQIGSEHVEAFLENNDDRFRDHGTSPFEAQIGGEMKQHEQSGISTMLSSVSKFAKGASSIAPALSTLTKPVEWMAESALSVASLFGFSKPTSQAVPAYMKQIPNPYSMNYDGIDTSRKLALSAANELETFDSFAGCDHDELALSHLVQKTALINRITWNMSQVSDTILYQTYVGPSLLRNEVSPTQGYTTGPHLWFAQGFFTHWRGDIEFTFHFVKTKFHTGRVQVTFIPFSKIADDYNFTSMPGFNYTEVFDLSQSSSFKFVVPYVSTRAWMLCHGGTDLRNHTTGRLVMTVVNPLVSPPSVSNVTDVMVEVGGASNFQFAGPRRTRWAVKPESEESTLTRTLRSIAEEGTDTVDTPVPAPTEVTAQIGSFNIFIGNRDVTIVTDGKRAKNAKSTTKLTSIPPALEHVSEESDETPEIVAQIGESDEAGKRSHINLGQLADARCFGESVRSFRQMLKRNRLIKQVQVPSGHLVGIDAWAHTPISSVYADHDIYSELYPIYGFMRGGMRLKIYVRDWNFTQAEPIKVRFYNNILDDIAQPRPTSAVDTAVATSIPKLFCDELPVIVSKEGLIELEIPYYCAAHMVPVEYGGITNSIVRDGNYPTPVIWIEGLGNQNITVYRSTSDDFSFGTLLGVPVMKDVRNF